MYSSYRSRHLRARKSRNHYQLRKVSSVSDTKDPPHRFSIRHQIKQDHPSDRQAPRHRPSSPSSHLRSRSHSKKACKNDRKSISSSPALLPAIYKRRPLMTDLHNALKSHGQWDGLASLSPTSLKCLKFFPSLQLIQKFTSRPLIATPDRWILTTDASPWGWGATLEDISADPSLAFYTKGSFSAEEQQASSNYRETLALTLAIVSFKDILLLSKKPIHFRTDNSTALSYIRKMGGAIHHLEEAIDPLVRFLIRHRIPHSAEHLPGKENLTADALSRSRRRDHDYQFSHSFFKRIDCPAHTIDLFASRLNAQTHRFASWFPDPKATFRDTFSLNWSKERPFAFPPIPLIKKVLSHFHHLPSPASLTLVVPFWPKAIWWPSMLLHLSSPLIQVPSRMILSTLHQRNCLQKSTL